MYDAASKCKIGRNFSSAAGTYDRYAGVQYAAARELLRATRDARARSIYEAGCGTGLYTRMLREEFPEAAILSSDVSGEMVGEARRNVRGVSFIIADAEKSAVRGPFDVVTSNAAAQWLNLEPALKEWRALLKPGGTLLFSAFGPGTYGELGSILHERGMGPVAARGFSDRKELERVAGTLFGEVSVREIIEEKAFASLRDLLETVKYTGARGQGNVRNGLCTGALFEKIESEYRVRYNGIRATYQIFICEAK